MDAGAPKAPVVKKAAAGAASCPLPSMLGVVFPEAVAGSLP